MSTRLSFSTKNSPVKLHFLSQKCNQNDLIDNGNTFWVIKIPISNRSFVVAFNDLFRFLSFESFNLLIWRHIHVENVAKLEKASRR